MIDTQKAMGVQNTQLETALQSVANTLKTIGMPQKAQEVRSKQKPMNLSQPTNGGFESENINDWLQTKIY